MKAIYARYYYAPICTESFASQDRLRNFFTNIDDRIQFAAINIFTDEIDLDDSFNNAEMKFIESLKTNKALLMYGKLFINDIEIPGFPPSIKHIEEVLNDLNLKANYDDLSAYYNSPRENKIHFDEKLFRTTKLEKGNSYDVCLICTKYSRYISEKNYSKTNWGKYELEKSKHLIESINLNNVIGFIEYNGDEPIGFIEGYSTVIASKYGFIVDSNQKSCMITCLHIREEAKGRGISKRLISRFLIEATEQGFSSVEVIGFPDDMNWQPVGLYKKMNFLEKRRLGELSLMYIIL